MYYARFSHDVWTTDVWTTDAGRMQQRGQIQEILFLLVRRSVERRSLLVAWLMTSPNLIKNTTLVLVSPQTAHITYTLTGENSLQ